MIGHNKDNENNKLKIMQKLLQSTVSTIKIHFSKCIKPVVFVRPDGILIVNKPCVNIV